MDTPIGITNFIGRHVKVKSQGSMFDGQRATVVELTQYGSYVLMYEWPNHQQDRVWFHDTDLVTDTTPREKLAKV